MSAVLLLVETQIIFHQHKTVNVDVTFTGFNVDL